MNFRKRVIKIVLIEMIVLISICQADWQIVSIGSGTSPMYGITLGQGRNDGANRIYSAGGDSWLYEFSWENSWLKRIVGNADSTLLRIKVGDAKNDGIYRIYGGGLDNKLYEFYFINNSWQKNVIGDSYTDINFLEIGYSPSTSLNSIYIPSYWDYMGNHYYFKSLKWTGTNWKLDIYSASVYGDSEFYKDVKVGFGRNDGINRIYYAHGNSVKEWVAAGTWGPTYILVGSGELDINEMFIGQGRSDGINRIYAASVDGHVYEFFWNGTSYSKVDAGFSNGGIKTIYVGDLKNKGRQEIYVGNSNGELFLYYWNENSWSNLKIATFPASINAVIIGNGRNDSMNRLYVACGDNHVYEVTYFWQSPTNFSGIPLSSTSIEWQWNDTSSEDSYIIFSDTGGAVSPTLSKNTTFWIEENLLPNTQYRRYVANFSNNGDYGESGLSSVYTLASIPSLIASSETSSSITLSWEGNGTRYKIERAPDNFGSPGTWSALKIWTDNFTTTKYTDTNLQPNTTYWYRVSAYNGDGIESEPSTALAWQTGPGIPTTPTDAGIWLATTTVVFNWTLGQAIGADKYHVQVGTFPGGNSVLDEEVGINITSITVTGEDSHFYYCRVRAKNNNGKYGTWTESSNGVGVDITPPQPTNVISPTHPSTSVFYAVPKAEFVLDNNDFSGVVNYYIVDNNPNTIPTTNDSNTLNSLTINNLSDGVYYLHILSKDNAGNLGNVPTHFRFNIKTLIDKDTSNTYYFSDNSTLYIPQNTLSNNDNIIISSISLLNSPISNNYIKPLNKVYDIHLLSGIKKLLRPVTLILRYQDDEVSNINEDNLRIAYWDERKLIWVPIYESIPSPTENKVTANLEHFSFYTIVELNAGEGNVIDKAYNYPNPFSPENGTTIRLILKNNANIKINIYDIKGSLVREISSNGNMGINDIFWDGKDKNGNLVKSEIFLIKIEVRDTNGKKYNKTIKSCAWRSK